MSELLSAIDSRREAILLGELGALLHMIGKCSREFLIANSSEGGGSDSHQDLKHFPILTLALQSGILRDSFAFTPDGQLETLVGDFTDFITKYKGDNQDSVLLRLFNTCHRMTSADEKGVVRRKQSKDDMWIVTPFGYRAHKIELDRVDGKRAEMDRQLADAFDSYLSNHVDIKELRERAICILKPGLSEALGETRQPANDVTLWAQSHGVASLYKPVLAALAMGLAPCPRKNDSLDYNNVTWRLFGIGWNGQSFVERGRSPGDILQRQDILSRVEAEIQKRIEVAHPVGNLFYADLNGLFFTFPGIEDNAASDLAGQLASELIGIVREQSQNELWPFFTLSKSRRTLTAITQEIEVRGQIASAPRVAALLSMEQGTGKRREELLSPGPTLPRQTGGQEVCPVCLVRSKHRDEETCPVCEDRRSNRQRTWEQRRSDQTIWLDEVADTNGRLALVTLKFDLSRWWSGEWLTTIWSQMLSDWAKGERFISADGRVVRQLRQLVDRGEIRLPDHSDYTSARSLAEWVLANPNRTECKPVLEAFLEKGGGEYQVSEVPTLLREVQETYGVLSAESLLKFFFMQNASPARLARLWGETEDFLDTLNEGIEAETFVTRSQRLGFTTSTPVPGLRAGRTYRVVVQGLMPGPLVVLCLNESRQDFLTVDSLQKFQLEQGDRRSRGANAVQDALSEAGIESWFDETMGKQLPGTGSRTAVYPNRFHREPYLPFIALARSPVFCQLLLPANHASSVLRQILALADARFGKVQGKVPLHVSVLVAKRRFPLYALIEAGQQALDHPQFGDGVSQPPWWETTDHSNDPFYGHYPTIAPNGAPHRLTDLAPVDGGQTFWLTPGYFDFDFLGSTADRHRLAYEAGAGASPIRPSIAYGKLHPRPFALHHLRCLFEIWDVLTLTARLSTTQLHDLEETMVTKLEEWSTVGASAETVFQHFSKTLLRRSLGPRWLALSDHQRELLERSAQDGLLLETLELFQHVLKEGSPDE